MNKVDSHIEVVRMLVDEHVQNLHAVDDHAADARSLALEPRGRPNSPSGHRFREDIVDDRRDDLLDDYAAAVRAIDDALSKERQRNALLEAVRRGTHRDHEHWSLLKDMSLAKRSFAGVDEFEDADTNNRFYRWRNEDEEAARLAAADEGVAKSAEQLLKDMDLTIKFSSTPPPQFVFEEQISEAVMFIRKRSDVVRSVGDWETLVDARHADECLLYELRRLRDPGGDRRRVAGDVRPRRSDGGPQVRLGFGRRVGRDRRLDGVAGAAQVGRVTVARRRDGDAGRGGRVAHLYDARRHRVLRETGAPGLPLAPTRGRDRKDGRRSQLHPSAESKSCPLILIISRGRRRKQSNA